MPKPEPISTRLVRMLPQRALTTALGKVGSAPVPRPVRTAVYRSLAGMAGADLTEIDGDLREFRTINEVFARPIVPGARPWLAAPGAYGMPADGTISAQGRVTAGQMVQAKGIDYEAADLVAGALDADELEGALYSTVYLAPSNYHRVHSPAAGTLTRVTHVGGELWPVNGTSVPYVDRLFCRNERVVFRLERAGQPPAAVVLVGATVVGYIRVSVDGVGVLDNRESGQRVTDGAWPIDGGAELGAFLLGSTVIVVAADPEEHLRVVATAGDKVRVGQPLFDNAPAR